MHTLIAQPLTALHLVTNINRLVALRHRGAHQSRLAGHVGTSNTFLVTPKAQRNGGKHRLGAA